jgi:threonine/homoserine/homoserine lactone efflux protein
MGWQTVSAFMAATIILLVMPGQIMAIIAGTTLEGGRMAGLRTVLGIGLGEAMLIAATFASILASNALISSLFPWISLAGAGYLFWLSLNALQGPKHPLENEGYAARRPFLNGFVIALSNPTVLLFYAAFFMQFIDRTRPVALQALVLAVMYLLTSLAFDLGCVFLAARVRSATLPRTWLRQGARLACAVIYLGTGIAAFNNFLAPQL